MKMFLSKWDGFHMSCDVSNYVIYFIFVIEVDIKSYPPHFLSVQYLQICWMFSSHRKT